MLRRQKMGLGIQVYEHVKQLLLDGALDVETLIPIDTIAADLGVSRQPVMEAVRRLALEGFVSITPQVGSFPRQYDRQERIDFYKLLAEAECVCVGLACQRATPAEVKRLQSVSHEIGQLIGGRLDEVELAREYRRLNQRFHSEIHGMIKSAALAETTEMMGDLGDFLVATAAAPIFMERLKVAHREHEAIIAAIEARDSEIAVLTMRRHVLAVADRIARMTGRENSTAAGAGAED